MGEAVGDAIAVVVAVGGSVGAAVGSNASTVVAWSTCADEPAGDDVHPSIILIMATTASVPVVIKFRESTRAV